MTFDDNFLEYCFYTTISDQIKREKQDYNSKNDVY